MAREWDIEVVGAVRTERGVLDVERDLSRELRNASRLVRELLVREARRAAPQPRDNWEEKGAGIDGFVRYERRLAGRAPGGAPLVSLTYTVGLFVEPDHLAAYFETGTGLHGPAGSEYPIYPRGNKGGLLLHGPAGELWEGNQPGRGRFRGGEKGEGKPIFQHVMHPGIAPRPFLEDTAHAHSNEVDAIYDRAVNAAVRGF